MYKVYHMNRFIKSFPTRDQAMTFVLNRTGGGMGDYEILDSSDFSIHHLEEV